MNYKESGVDIDAGNRWVDRIKNILDRHPGAKAPCPIGGFNGAFDVGGVSLAACCDGVGTKLLLAKTTGLWSGIGRDLLGMNVNDLVTTGAKPLFFLDYIACGKLQEEALEPIVDSLAEGCAEIGCALLGGETAEMPGLYAPDEIDVAGFAVGQNIPRQLKAVSQGDRLVALPSSGPHSNGYSLIRALLAPEIEEGTLHSLTCGDQSLAQALMAPTRLYVNQALAGFDAGLIKSAAHITGGGLEENTARATQGHTPHFDWKSWRRSPLFDLLVSRTTEEEARRVFNLGLGFVAITDQPDELIALWKEMGEEPLSVGEVW